MAIVGKAKYTPGARVCISLTPQSPSPNYKDYSQSTGCRNITQCHLKQSFSGLHSPRRSYLTNSYDSWVQTIYSLSKFSLVFGYNGNQAGIIRGRGIKEEGKRLEVISTIRRFEPNGSNRKCFLVWFTGDFHFVRAFLPGDTVRRFLGRVSLTNRNNSSVTRFPNENVLGQGIVL